MIGIADTSFVLAVGNKSEPDHLACVSVFKSQQKIYLPQSTLTEIAYILGKWGGNQAVAHFLRTLSVMKYELITLLPQDVIRTADILDKYADSRVDFVDATIAAVAERLNITRILTLDQRDFQILRPQHISRFELLPQPG